jgi:hypothetical protein
MLMSRDIRVLHLESTDVCQAACPLCARETNPRFDPEDRHHLTVDHIVSVFGREQIGSLHKMFMCGNYGDPAAGHHTLDIYRAFREINPEITLGMNSNGGLQNPTWWQELASVMTGPRDYVVFSIDGLEDTNSIYRVNVSWKKVMANAEAFIGAGGSAHWDMLVYQHNQHQVDQVQEFARSIGFSWFRAKVSKRQPVKGLQYPVQWKRPHVASGPIHCHALTEQSAYLDARGNLHPCCWLGDRLDQAPVDFAEVQQTWLSDSPNPVCRRNCSSDDSGTSFTNQWQRNVALK